MLQQFLSENRAELVERCRRKVALRAAPGAPGIELEHGIPLFLEQLIAKLRNEPPSASAPDASLRSRTLAQQSAEGAMVDAATAHGAELLRHAFPIDQVVHHYGDLCQAIMELAIERRATIEVAEFQTLNKSLDDAIADAVTEYSSARATVVDDHRARVETERLGLFVHELRNHIHTVTLALTAIKAGNVGLFGATGAVLDRSLTHLRDLIDRTVAEVRTRVPPGQRHEAIPLAGFLKEAQMDGAMQARSTECEFVVGEVDPDLIVVGDSALLMSALSNLLQNAFKFSRGHGRVSMNAYERGDRILIDVADSCGGLPAGSVEALFEPFAQAGANRSGLGLGLSIARRSIEANAGSLSVRDMPGTGCVFTIDLPRHEP
ncbi:MAG TPA: HAMP domain-containing sensor histidine kinase [Usitatibacter sp.]|nr:HAMP domain-containing sensor histidine kinase [Usitatibacter sp.]